MIAKFRTGWSMSENSKLSCLLASLATQIRAAIQVGVPVEDSGKARHAEECELTLGPAEAQLRDEWGDAPGRMTRNGLGSLEIGAGKTRVDE